MVNSKFIKSLVARLTQDTSLREDLYQEAVVLLPTLPENKHPGYYRRAVRYHLLNYLRSYNTGNWFVGRDSKDPRYIRIDDLLASGVQIDTDLNIYGQGAIYAHLNFNQLTEY